MYQDLQKYSDDKQRYIDGFDEYGGLKIFGSEEIHEIIFENFMELNPGKNDRILILGAGSGSFDQRLINNGFLNITSTDFLGDRYLVKGVDFHQFDLNKVEWDFCLGEFDYIFAVEVIEHLENQFAFLRNCKKFLKKNGVLFVSTPNITNTLSKANFICKGELLMFSRGDLEDTGHIQIIAPHIFEYNYKSNEFSLLKHTCEKKTGLKFPTYSIRAALGFFVYSFLMLFLWGNKNKTDIFLLRKR